MSLFQLGSASEYNKMTLDNLAVVFAPSLLWSPNQHVDVNDLMKDTYQTKYLVLHFITHPEGLFEEKEIPPFSSGKVVTIGEFAKMKEQESAKKRRELKKLEKQGSVIIGKNQMKKLRSGHYTQRKYRFKFNVLCVSKVPSALVKENTRVCLKVWVRWGWRWFAMVWMNG